MPVPVPVPVPVPAPYDDNGPDAPRALRGDARATPATPKSKLKVWIRVIRHRAEGTLRYFRPAFRGQGTGTGTGTGAD